MGRYEFRFRRGSAARWTESNPILGPGEPGVEIDTGLFKIGDGHTAWNGLDYFIPRDFIENLIDIKIGETGGGSGDPRIGDMSELTTEDQSKIVSAINEINMDGVEFTLLYDNAKAG